MTSAITVNTENESGAPFESVNLSATQWRLSHHLTTKTETKPLQGSDTRWYTENGNSASSTVTTVTTEINNFQEIFGFLHNKNNVCSKRH
jgi:hypothetical protein